MTTSPQPPAPDAAESGYRDPLALLAPQGADDGTVAACQRMLLATDGSMVRLLEAGYGEPIQVADCCQTTEALTAADGELAPAGSATVLRRTVRLCGRHTARTFVVAESATVLERLPTELQQALLTSDEPLGRLLATYRVETRRDFRHAGWTHAGAWGAWFALDSNQWLLWRTTRLVGGGQPITAITEYVPPQPPPPA